MPTELLSDSDAVREAGALLPRQRRALTEAQQRRYDEALVLTSRAFAGNKRAMLDMQEALTTSDFQFLFGSILDRQLMAQYAQLPSFWTEFAARAIVNDFRPKRWIDLLGGRAALSLVPERNEYPSVALSDAKYDLRVLKYGDRLGLSWEDFVNDDLDALRGAPSRLAEAAKNTEDRVAAGLLATAAGPSATFFTTTRFGTDATKQASSNILLGNPSLTVDSLKAALIAIGQRKDSDGRPIVVPVAILMVPPALEAVANDILNAKEIRTTVGAQTVVVGNWLAGRVKVVINPWIPLVDTSASASTTWYLLPSASNPRPAVVMGFLRGHEVPDLRVSNNTGTSVGGGALGPEDGSFENDDVQWRVRHVTGGTALDPISTVVSKGTNAA